MNSLLPHKRGRVNNAIGDGLGSLSQVRMKRGRMVIAGYLGEAARRIAGVKLKGEACLLLGRRTLDD